MQALIAKEATFREGIGVLLALRSALFTQITAFVEEYPPEAFFQMPFPRAEGYHSKTLAYSLWHIFRIEDIVAHTLIGETDQMLFSGGWLEKTKSPIITTGNELQGAEIAAFSQKLDVQALYGYCAAVMESTNRLLQNLTFKDLKRKFTDADRQRLIASQCVSLDENAFWLIDYWCGKDVQGLIRMPFSRHWIMHVEACLRIAAKLRPTA